MNAADVSFGLAVLAGAASFLSPCVLALVPAYIGYLGGRAVTTGGVQFEVGRANTFLHGVAFVLGFSAVFIALGAAASAIGALLFDMREVLTRVGGIVIIVFGLHTMGVITLKWLDYDTRKQFNAKRGGLDYGSSALMGVFFSAGWAPCVGPVLGAVLTMALTQDGVGQGVVLLSGYSLGLAIPFLIAALAIGQVSLMIRRLGKWMRYFQIANGVLLIVIGLLLFSGAMSVFNIQFASNESLLVFQESIDTNIVAFWNSLTGRAG